MENENTKVKKKSKALIIGIVAAVAIIAIGIVLFILKPWSAGYVGTVGDLKITKQEYMVFSKFNMSEFLSSNSIDTTADKYDWSQKFNNETAKDQVKKSTLDNIQEIKIQLIKAKDAGIKLTDEELKSIDEAIDSKITSSGSKDAAEEAIQSEYGVSLSEYRDFYKKLALAQKYFNTERTNSKLSSTEDEIKEYYNANKKSFDKATITHIAIYTIDSNGAEVSASKKSEAKKQAEELLAKVKAGEDIKELAVKNSSDTNAANDKGELTFANGELSSQIALYADLEKWAFSNSVGTVGIVEAAYGYEVVKLDKIEESAYDDVKANIKASLDYTKFATDFSNKLDTWKKDKQFEIIKNDKVLEKTDLKLYGI